MWSCIGTFSTLFAATNVLVGFVYDISYVFLCSCESETHQFKFAYAFFAVEHIRGYQNDQCFCCFHIKPFFLPSDISSTPSVLADSSS